MHAHTPPREKTLAITSSSWPNREALATREVLAQPCVTFHPVRVNSLEALLRLLLR
jgi:hypothetical protein